MKPPLATTSAIEGAAAMNRVLLKGGRGLGCVNARFDVVASRRG
jgi:hypothetical protein